MFTITNTYKKSRTKMTITVTSDLPKDEVEINVQDHLDNEFDDEWMVFDSTFEKPNIFKVQCENVGV